MKNKSFSKSMHDKWDALGKEAVKRFFEERNLTAIPNPKSEFIIDMHVLKGDKLVAYAEAEVRDCWVGPVFYYPTIHVPYRKKHYFEGALPAFYFAMNFDCSYTMVVKAKDILQSDVVRKDNSYKRREPFFDVPKSKGTLYKLGKALA